MAFADMFETLYLYFTRGLEPGGLAMRIITMASDEELRRSCHVVVEDDMLTETVDHIRSCLFAQREDGYLVMMVEPWWAKWHPETNPKPIPWFKR